MTSKTGQPPATRPRRNAIIRMFASVWFGVAILALILIYSSIISALPPVRWTLEMTEMQAFGHWFFATLVILFGVSLVATTFFRLRWTAVNAGALAAHVGLLLLTGGALAYFGTKVEGNVLLQSPMIEVQARVANTPRTIGRFRAAPGEAWTRALPHLEQPLTIRVRDVQTEGVQPMGAKIELGSSGSEQRTIELSAGGEEWTPIGAGLDARLITYPAQADFYDNATPALYIRNLSAGTELTREIRHLPIYHDHYGLEHGLLTDSRGMEIEPERARPALRLFGLSIPTGWFERWRMPIEVNTEELPFSVEITGYVAYVTGVLPQQGADGHMRTVPVVAVREQRRSGILPRAMSAIRLKISGRDAAADWSETQWCLFSIYPEVDSRPLRVTVPGSNGTWELVYSRLRRELNATLAAQDLSVTYFPGRRGIEGYRSDILVQQGGGPVQATTVETNHICRLGSWTLYQSGFAEDHWSYSILGVGNRNGMLPMNMGWIITTLGCLYAFYIKPVIVRRGEGLRIED